jgi:hypothetical protein
MKAHRQIDTDTSRDKGSRVVDRTLSTIHLEDLAAVSQAAIGTKQILEHYGNFDRNVKAKFATWG